MCGSHVIIQKRRSFRQITPALGARNIMLIATFQKLQRCKYAAGELIYRFTVDPPHGRSAPGRSAPFTGRSAPPSWSIRPVEFEGRKDRGNGADRPRRCTRSFRPTRMSRLVKEAAVAAVTTVSRRQCRQSPPGLPPCPDESLN